MYITDPKNNIEIASKVPKVDALLGEIEEALTDAGSYFTRCQDNYDFWHARWPGQTADGRKHSDKIGDDAWPWENASDTTVRLAEHFVDQYVGLKRRIFMQARWQATALRPLVDGKEASQVTLMLKWMIYTHMRSEVLREIPLAFAWQGGYGASAIRVGWEQEERVGLHELSLPILEEFVQSLSNPNPALNPAPNPNSPGQGRLGAGQGEGNPQLLLRLLEALHDPAQEPAMIGLLQQLSPLVSRNMAAQILEKLRANETTEIPVPYTFKNKPCWTARKFGVDLIVPAGTRDLQKSRFVGESEWVTETELKSRVLSRDYNQAFVDEVLKHRGETQTEHWTALSWGERGRYTSGGFIGVPQASFEYRNLFQLLHAHYHAIDEWDRSCIYTTVVSPSLIRLRGSSRILYATHGLLDYDHGLYPYIPLRYETKEAALLSSQSIPLKVHTWEDEIKTQRDGRTDLTALWLRPPIIVPFARQNAIKATPLPGAALGLSRSDLVRFMEPPAPPTTSIEIEQNNLQWAREFMGLFGVDVDPEWKSVCRGNVTDDTVSEMILLGDMTLDVIRQYELDDEVAQVVGPLQRPFHVDRETLLQKHQLQISFDPRMLNENGVEEIAKIVEALLPFDRGGTTDTNALYKVLMQAALPDVADQFIQEAGPATERERNDEQDAITAAMAGVAKPVPAHGNFQLRLQVIQETLQNPQIQQELMQKKVSQEIVKKRIEYFQNQIQQYQVNPQIGRTLATAPMQPRQPIATTSLSGQLGY